MSAPAAATDNNNNNDGAGAPPPNEEDLRKQLRAAMQKLKSREPLDPTYKRLLMNGIVTPRRPVLPKDNFYKRIRSHLRERVERYAEQNQGKDSFDRIAQRQPLDESAMRAALTLRDAKEHEQQALLEATLAAIPRSRNGMDEAARKRHFDGIAAFLQSRENKPHHHHHLHHHLGHVNNPHHRRTNTKTPPPPQEGTSAMEQTERARQQAELDRQREMAKAREDARTRRDDEDRQQREDEITARKNKAAETPQQALHKLYHPIFKTLWNMEFPQLGGINPFRIVIDRDNCASVGAPDYFDVIERPMNLTYIQHKVDAMEYESLSQFFADVDLMIRNALLYNSDPGNPYHAAAQEMKKRYVKIVKRVLHTIQTKQQQQAQQRR